MAELPKGVTKEVRRGGSGILELLLIDFDKASDDGYLRVERPTQPVSVGQLVIIDGTPSMCLFEFDELLMGQRALDALRDSAAEDDSRISVHSEVDFALIADLHPEAKLHIDEEDFATGERMEGWIDTASDRSDWWRRKQNREWTQVESSTNKEDVEAEEEAEEEFLDYTPGEELEAGGAYLLDSADTSASIKVAAHLGVIGHPLLVISRTPPTRLEDEFSIPVKVCRWMTERSDTEHPTVRPQLESIALLIEEFRRVSTRAVVVLDGIEYLGGVHGFDSLIGMLRNLVDGFQTSDDLMLVPADISVWEGQERSLLMREFDRIPQERMESWAERPSTVEGHGFCQVQEGATIPEPEDLDVEQVASADFKAAASRLLTGDDVQSPSNDTEPSMTSENIQASFSAKSIIEQMKIEDADAPTVELATPATDTENSDSNTEVQSDELPEWATKKSANMMEQKETTIPVVIDSEAQSDQEQELETDDIPSEADEKVEEDPEVPEVKDPKQPTVNHRSAPSRKVQPGRVPDKLEFESDSTRYAASNSKTIETELNIPGYEALDPALTALNSNRGQYRDLPDWETNEERDWKVLRLREMQEAVGSSRSVSKRLRDDESQTSASLHLKQWNAAVDSASTIGESSMEPLELEKPMAREAAVRAQKVRTLTELLASGERAALYADREKSISDAGIDVETLSRVHDLAERGHPIRELVERLEANRKEGKRLLKKMESNSKLAEKLIKKMNILEEKGIIDGKVSKRYRKDLVNLKKVEKIESLLNDLG